MITVYQRESGILWLSATFNGTRIRRSLGTRDKRIASVVAERVVREILNPDSVKPVEAKNQPDRLQTLIDRFLPLLQQSGRKPRTVAGYQTNLRRFCRDMGNPSFDQIDCPMVTKWLNGLDCSATRKHSIATNLKAAFGVMVELGVIEHNPIADLKKPKLQHKGVRFLSRQEVTRLLKLCADNEHVTRLVALCLFAGLRQAEAVNCQWDWFDSEAGLLRVKQSDSFSTKSGKERAVPLHPRLVELYQRTEDKSGYVVGGLSKPVGRKWLEANWNPCRDQLGVEGITLHTLRKTFGSLLLETGVAIEKISAWLGHSSVTVTEQHYAQLRVQRDSQIEGL